MLSLCYVTQVHPLQWVAATDSVHEFLTTLKSRKEGHPISANPKKIYWTQTKNNVDKEPNYVLPNQKLILYFMYFRMVDFGTNVPTSLMNVHVKCH